MDLTKIILSKRWQIQRSLIKKQNQSLVLDGRKIAIREDGWWWENSGECLLVLCCWLEACVHSENLPICKPLICLLFSIKFPYVWKDSSPHSLPSSKAVFIFLCSAAIESAGGSATHFPGEDNAGQWTDASMLIAISLIRKQRSAHLRGILTLQRMGSEAHKDKGICHVKSNW